MTTDEFIRSFRIKKTSLFGLWKDLSNTPEGQNPSDDCQSFAWSVLILETGSKAKALLALLTLRAMLWRCWSDKNHQIPRHAALWMRGKGWIDSTDRFWRPSPAPHKRAWPVGAPVLVGLAVAAKMWAG